ncbi:MAG TPA: hypothetical protein VM639_10370 [Dongiaceae bacterium]|nr:hypothetical protein [Dongiaceae bacterium]
MTTTLDARLRETFAAIADVLIPNAEGMPAASEVKVHETMLDHIVALRPDLREDLLRGLTKAAGRNATEAANDLNKTDAAALSAIGLVASAGYYMTPRIRELIGYPGQESRPDSDPDAVPEYVKNGMLQQVIDRGPIFKPTPK